SISRDIASLLGGELFVESELGKGSTFTFLLPVDVPSLDESPATPPTSRERSSDARILPEPRSLNGDRAASTSGVPMLLIVEDDERFAKTLRDMAHERNFSVIVTDRGVEAVDLAKRLGPDAITLDLRLPDVDG